MLPKSSSPPTPLPPPNQAQGLAYGLSVAEAIVAPAMPSSTARAGGIFMPIIASLAHGGGSEPGKGGTIGVQVGALMECWECGLQAWNRPGAAAPATGNRVSSPTHHRCNTAPPFPFVLCRREVAEEAGCLPGAEPAAGAFNCGAACERLQEAIGSVKQPCLSAMRFAFARRNAAPRTSSYLAPCPQSDLLLVLMPPLPLQAASHSSNMYLTAAAQNLLCVKLAGEMG